MVDERVVSVKLEQVEQYYGEFKTKQETLSRQEFLSSTTEQRAVERMFENAIQAYADLAQHIASHEYKEEAHGFSRGRNPTSLEPTHER